VIEAPAPGPARKIVLSEDAASICMPAAYDDRRTVATSPRHPKRDRPPRLLARLEPAVDVVHVETHVASEPDAWACP
jgi:hypothetical protein